MDHEKEINILRRWLRNEYVAIAKDKTLFEDCKMGRISLNKCKREMMKNNSFPSVSEQIVSDEAFRIWLNSIGYEVMP